MNVDVTRSRSRWGSGGKPIYWCAPQPGVEPLPVVIDCHASTTLALAFYFLRSISACVFSGLWMLSSGAVLPEQFCDGGVAFVYSH